MNLGKLYKDLRKSDLDENGKPIGVNSLATKIGIASSRISEIEHGKRDMSLTELKAYHRYFNVSMEYLLGETTSLQSMNWEGTYIVDNTHTDILTDKGNRAFVSSSFDMAIPYCQSGELGEIMQRINELSDELKQLTERATQIYAHGYVKISLNSDCEKD